MALELPIPTHIFLLFFKDGYVSRCHIKLITAKLTSSLVPFKFLFAPRLQPQPSLPTASPMLLPVF